MKHHVNYEKPSNTYKIPNPNFPQQLCSFLSQSKHQKQQQYSDINQYMVEQFIHLFQICNINRFIDYTDQFINEIRNVILRLQLVQKRQSQYLDQKDQFMYLIVQGNVKTVRRQKPIVSKRVSKLNNTGFNFQSNSLIGHFNSRSSHQTFHNIQLKEFQKSVIMDRNSRMTLLNGNLWSEMVSSPRKKMKMEQQNNRGLSYFSTQKRESGLSINRAHIHNFQQKDFFLKEKFSYTPKPKNYYGTQLLQPLQDEVYQCLNPVKYIKLLKWSYDQLVQYVFKYQNDRLIEFLSRSLLISQHDIKFHQVYNKTAFLFYPKKQSQHSNMFIGLEKGAMYILRKGSLEMKYQSKQSLKTKQVNSSILTSNKSNPNLAQYISKPETFYKKVIMNEGAIICPELQPNNFFLQSLQDVVFIEIDHCLLQILKSELKDNWWTKKFKSFYQKIKVDRSHYMKEQDISQKEEIKQLKMNNVSIESKSGKFRSGNKQKSRFRVETKNLNNKMDSIKENTIEKSEDKENTQEEFSSEEYKQFVSFLPYEIMIKSKQKISMKLNQKSKNRHISNKVFNYLKKNQKGNSSSKYKDKIFDLKMKNIASKQLSPQDLKNLYNDINNDESKREFHKSLKGNWFKEQTQISSNPTFDENTIQRTSLMTHNQNKNMLIEKKGLETYKSSTQIGGLGNDLNEHIQKFSDKVHSSRIIDKKVTFINSQKDDSSQQEFLCNNDTGLINKFVQKSHNYQKQLNFLLNSSQREQKSQMKHKKKVKTCKTQGSNVIFSQNLINDIMKRVNHPNKKSSTIFSNKNSEKLSKSHSACDQTQHQNSQEVQDKIRFSQENNQNAFSAILSGKVEKKIEIHDGNDIVQKKEDENAKQHKTSSFTNYSSMKSSSCKAIKSNKAQSLDRKRTSIVVRDRKENYVQSAFFKQNVPRPCTAQVPSRECRSLFFNQWIESQPGTAQSNEHRFSQLAQASYNFCGANVSSGDKKIWKRLQSGKIVKKSVKFFNKKNGTTANIQLVNKNKPVFN